MSYNIAVAGKGGSGKTTVASLVIRYLKKNGLVPILAVDADANANLGDSLGLSARQTVGSIIAGFNEEKINIPPGMTKEAYLEVKLHDAMVESILEMAKRRPLRASDIATLFNMPLEEAEGVVKGLEIKGTLRQQEHLGEVYYRLG